MTTALRFGAEVRARRKAAGLSQKAVADAMRAMGFSWRQTTTAKTEAAERPVPIDEAVALASLFGVALGELVGEPPTAPDPAALERALRRVDAAGRDVEESGRRLDAALAELAELERTEAPRPTKREWQLGDAVRDAFGNVYVCWSRSSDGVVRWGSPFSTDPDHIPSPPLALLTSEGGSR